MGSSDVFKGAGETRLTEILLDGPTDQVNGRSVGQPENLDRIADALEGIGTELAAIIQTLTLADSRPQIPATVQPRPPTNDEGVVRPV